MKRQWNISYLIHLLEIIDVHICVWINYLKRKKKLKTDDQGWRQWCIESILKVKLLNRHYHSVENNSLKDLFYLFFNSTGKFHILLGWLYPRTDYMDSLNKSNMADRRPFCWNHVFQHYSLTILGRIITCRNKVVQVFFSTSIAISQIWIFF